MALELPLCKLSLTDLSPAVGAGNYGEVHPVDLDYLTGAACNEALALLMPTATGSSAGEADVKFAVKIFRESSLTDLMGAEHELRGITKSTWFKLLRAVKRIRYDAAHILVRQLSSAKAATPANFARAVTSYLNFLCYLLAQQLDLKDALNLSVLKEILQSPRELDTLKFLQQAKNLRASDFLRHIKTMRKAASAKSFLDELEKVGQAFIQIEKALQKIDLTVWAAIQDSPARDRVSHYSAMGRSNFSWALPLGRVLAKDQDGQLYWGFLMELFDGDMKVCCLGQGVHVPIQPTANTKREGFYMDGWVISDHNNALKKLLEDKHSLLAVSSGLLQPFVFMHNFFGLGHLDIKPANLLFSINRQVDPRSPPRLAAGDFGMAAPLGQPISIQGTLAFMPPELETPKRHFPLASSYLRVAMPDSDVYALGLTLSYFWGVSTQLPSLFPWIERCIVPNLSAGAKFSFGTLASPSPPQLYTPELRAHLKQCMQPGGKIEKLYISPMPLLVKTKIAQMTEVNAMVRISMSNAYAYLSVAGALEEVRLGSKEGSRMLGEAKATVIFPLALQRSQLIAVNAEGPERQHEATKVLRALQDLACAPLSRTLKLNVHHLFLVWYVAAYSPIEEAVGASIGPLSLETVLPLKRLPAATAHEIETVKQQLAADLNWPSLQQQNGADEKIRDLVDAVFGVCMEGLDLLIQQEIVARKMAAASIAVAKATQLYVHTEIFASYVSWASVDRLSRVALRRCVSSLPVASTIHMKQASGAKVSEEELSLLQDCIWNHLEAATRETHYGLPWGVARARNDFGFTEAKVTEIIINSMINNISQTAWTTENAKKLLQLQVARAIYRLPYGSLPKGTDYMGIFEAVMLEMSRDRFVPIPFLNWEAREEYTEALYGLTLKQFREAVTLFATKEELHLKAVDTLRWLTTEQKMALTASSLSKLLPEALREPRRFSPSEADGKSAFEELLNQALTKAREVIALIRRLTYPAKDALNELVGELATLNSCATTKHPPGTLIAVAVVGNIAENYISSSAGYADCFPYTLLCVTCSSLAPGCRLYTAVLTRPNTSGGFDTVDEEELLVSPDEQHTKYRVLAVPPKTGTGTPHTVQLHALH
ncbi:uncharacterized protein LOC34619882 [Cyclospora cayetanensis]|uniref:Uncharacterized protein LOC34619882 n=1 Tax=Cyclospora cayetanensis TaxID=88456 RepID=A0A6P6RZG9_9EIME|nr:uncharacterized protein LOC34619882 [Cyclospora cayetanensis]